MTIPKQLSMAMFIAFSREHTIGSVPPEGLTFRFMNRTILVVNPPLVLANVPSIQGDVVPPEIAQGGPIYLDITGTRAEAEYLRLAGLKRSDLIRQNGQLYTADSLEVAKKALLDTFDQSLQLGKNLMYAGLAIVGVALFTSVRNATR